MMTGRKRKEQKNPVVAPDDTKSSLEAAQHNENYDSEVTLSHNADGLWFWHKDGKTSEVGYNHPSMARLSAPSKAKPNN